MPYPKAKDHTPRLQTEYEGRFPTLTDLLRHGGLPGYRYHLAHAAHIGEYQRQGADLVDKMTALTITGPKGTATAFLLCSGKPIPGADPMNGIRKYDIDPLLEQATGLDSQDLEAEHGSEAEVEAAGALPAL